MFHICFITADSIYSDSLLNHYRPKNKVVLFSTCLILFTRQTNPHMCSQPKIARLRCLVTAQHSKQCFADANLKLRRISPEHGPQRPVPHLVEVPHHDAGVKEGGILHQLEELDVVVAVDGIEDLHHELHCRRFTDLFSQLLGLSVMFQ